MSEIKITSKMEITKFENKLERFAHSNRLIEARYSLSPQEQRLVLMMVSMIMPSDADFKEYQLPIRDFAEFFKIKGNSIIPNLKKAAKSLTEKSIIIHDENRTLYTSWISSAEFPDGESYVALCFDPKLKPYLLQLKGQYTFLENKYLVQLKSAYSIRIYMLLKQYTNLKCNGIRKFDVEELRLILGIKPEEYKNYFDFKTNVIIKASTEINNKTDLFISFQEDKTGKRVTKIIFSITEKSPATRVVAVSGAKIIDGDESSDSKGRAKVNLDRNLENIEKYFTEKSYKSNPKLFFANQEKKRWRGVINWAAAADEWELNHAEMYPDKHKKNPVAKESFATAPGPTAEPLDISRIRYEVQRLFLGVKNPFAGCKIEKFERGFKIFADEKALKYQPELEKINVKIEVK